MFYYPLIKPYGLDFKIFQVKTAMTTSFSLIVTPLLEVDILPDVVVLLVLYSTGID
jgi:hypothetical protein